MIELFISLGVFTIGMAGVFALQTSIIKSNSLSSDISLASNLAGSALEQLRITKYADIVGASVCPAPTITDLHCTFDKQGQQTANPNDVYFTRAWESVMNPALSVKDITVRVTWNFTVASGGAGANTQSVTMRGRVYPR